jgi:hypothetical protein
LADLKNLPSLTARRAAAAAFYNSLLSLQLGKNGALALTVIKNHQDLFEHLVDYLSPSQRENIRQEPPGIMPIILLP